MERDNYKGNLIIIFNINYPNQLSSDQKTKLKEIL
jgi:DnaJ-class molecular chaperone